MAETQVLEPSPAAAQGTHEQEAELRSRAGALTGTQALRVHGYPKRHLKF